MAEHRTVLLEEAVAALNVRAGGAYVDCTFGRGGHSRRILAALGATGSLLALDRDPSAAEAAATIADPRFTFRRAAFSQLASLLDRPVDGVLFDLGASSPQLDDATRGFSFRADGPLDMRMDPSRGETARDWLARASESEIREVIATYGEERFAKQIARKIVDRRSERPVATTRDLAAIVASAVRTREPGQDPATRTFQAIRIFLNSELDELSAALPQAVERLAPGGRLVAISFHSLEDRIVKRFIAREVKGESPPRDLPLRASELRRGRLKAIGKPVRPSAEDVGRNPRARSAIMRVAERSE